MGRREYTPPPVSEEVLRALDAPITQLLLLCDEKTGDPRKAPDELSVDEMEWRYVLHAVHSIHKRLMGQWALPKGRAELDDDMEHWEKLLYSFRAKGKTDA